ncbi:unnamed protein product [Porites lobata]|uniref:TIR domain-containing protein n=1 Tax=Porites lobata TaxID=104759 RepID=A0ABN8PKF6_9CNID|nr:unnamed protein product [Porites lobata]
MITKRKIILVLVVCSFAVSSQPLLGERERCLQLCRLAHGQENGSKAETADMQVSSGFLSCPECLDRNKEKDGLDVPGTSKHRKRKSLSDPQPAQVCPLPSEAPQFVEWTPSEVNVSFGNYGNTDHWYINCSWSPMNDFDGKWNSILIRLGIATFSEGPDGRLPQRNNFTCFVLPKNQTFFKVNISSYHYHYPDPIGLKVIGLPFFKTWYFMTPYLPLLVTTVPSSTFSTITVTSYSEPSTAFPTTGSSKTVAHTVTILIGILTGLVLVVGLLAYILRSKRRKKAPVPSDYKYHVFIIYNNEDKLWMKKLLTFLEEKHNLKCCVHYRNWIIGRPFRDNMVESVNNSYKVIALFSSNSIKSNNVSYELGLAIDREEKSGDHSLALIRIDGVNFEELPSKLRNKTLIDYEDPSQRPIWKRKLLEFLDLAHNDDNNNSDDNQVNINNGVTRTRFSRLDSTTSNDSQTPLVS